MVVVRIRAAYAIARRVFIGRKTIYLLIVLTFAIRIHSILIPQYRLVDDFGMLNTCAGLILPHIAIMQFQGEYSSDWPKILAVVNLMMLPLLVIYILAQKHFIRAFAGMGK